MKDRFATARLAMRPHEAADAKTLHRGYGDAELMRWWSTPPHADVAETQAYLIGDDEDGTDDDDDGEPWQGWTVTLDGEPIGTLSAGPRRAGVYEIGYLLLRDRWGGGHGREMVAALIDMVFAEPGARRIYADVDPDNAASIALLTRLGFRQEGRLRAAWESHIGIRDALIFGLLREEWRRPDADPRVAGTVLARPVGMVGMALAVFGLVLAVVPGVPRPVVGVVLAIALLQIAAAVVLRRQLFSRHPDASRR